MIVFFGPAGAGKSVQGQMLAARMGWRWLSTGQMFRESKDPEVKEILKTGELISDEKTFEVVQKVLDDAKDIKRLIIDGFPRTMIQAEWLMEDKNSLGREVEMVVVLEVPESVIQERLELRGRDQDKPEIVARRMNIYRQEMYPVLSYFADKAIKIVHLDGTGTVGQVHDKIMAELEYNKLA
ncbi:MAG: adenylate kinase, subfamily protein nonfunctional [Candidatus Saccharibacteria bacterium]|nr:adenylate kinase, subfamily protein nonfunctional [Candidatus Saccharibacteria bacterium]